MKKRTLTVELPEELYEEFVGIVTEEKGRWRGVESPKKALESSVMAALMLFIHGLEGQKKLIELRDHLSKNPAKKNDGGKEVKGQYVSLLKRGVRK